MISQYNKDNNRRNRDRLNKQMNKDDESMNKDNKPIKKYGDDDNYRFLRTRVVRSRRKPG